MYTLPRTLHSPRFARAGIILSSSRHIGRTSSRLSGILGRFPFAQMNRIEDRMQTAGESVPRTSLINAIKVEHLLRVELALNGL